MKNKAKKNIYIVRYNLSLEVVYFHVGG